jgi:hypothetical protein
MRSFTQFARRRRSIVLAARLILRPSPPERVQGSRRDKGDASA